MRHRILILVLCGLIIPFFAFATDEALKAKGLCVDIKRLANGMFPETHTECLPSGVKEGKNATNFIIITKEAVFSVEAARKAWLLAVVGAVGKVMNDHPRMELGEVWVADAKSVKERKAWSLPGGLIKNLQAKLYVGKMTIEQAYSQILASLKERNYSRK